MAHAEIVYARSANGRIVHVDTVERGLGCACTCLGCGERLLSRQGRQLAWHFAHAADSACTGGGGETVLHLRAKQILLETPWTDLGARNHPKGELKPERGYPDSALRCDVGTEKVFAEVIVHHGLDEAKLRFIRALDAWVVVFDLSDQVKADLCDVELKSVMRQRLRVLQRPFANQHEAAAAARANNGYEPWNLDPTSPLPAGLLCHEPEFNLRTGQQTDARYALYASDGFYWWRTQSGLWWVVLSEHYAARLYMPAVPPGRLPERLYLVFKDFRRPRASTVTAHYAVRDLERDLATQSLHRTLLALKERRYPFLPSRQECQAAVMATVPDYTRLLACLQPTEATTRNGASAQASASIADRVDELL